MSPKPGGGVPSEAPLEQARQHFLQGVAAFEARRLSEACDAFRAALALAPGRASVLLNLGVTYFHLAQWDLARSCLQQAAAADDSQADAWSYLGLTHEVLAQWPAALDCLSRALALAPGQAGLWLAAGRCHARVGALDQAMAAFERALALDPNLSEAWSARGGLLRELHQLPQAAQCFERALALGADPELHGYYLASVRGADAPAAPPRLYVENLFDQYAADFGDHLVAQLRYQGHETLVRPLLQLGRRYGLVLDLGCGSGLCGKLIRPLADAIDGVDLSAAMLAQAAQLGVYRDLTHADLGAFLAHTPLRPDLVLAADVFIYVGELSAVFQAVRRILAPAGCFAFTVELAAAGAEVQLLPSLRYAHSEAYIRRLAATSGLRIRELFAAPLRYEQSVPVQGLYGVLE